MKKLFAYCFIIIIIFGTGNITAQNRTNNPDNQFALEFYKQIADSEKNFFFSPYSISLALAMTYEGAEGETAEEMRKVLHFPESKEETRESFASNKRVMTQSPDEDKYIFKIANAVWAAEHIKFKKSFFEHIKSGYGAPVNTVDFKDPKPRNNARKEMNRWTENNTEGKIKDLIKPTDLSTETIMVLINAVYFKAQWANTFKESKTKDDSFHAFDENITTAFMHQTKRMKYYKDNLISALEIPYYGNKASMHILLPHNSKNFDKLLNKLDTIYFNKIKETAEYTSVQLKLPKFRTENRIYLEEAFQKAGMKKPFERDADFSGMSNAGYISIDKIIHQSYIDLNENGTEAAAATAVIVKRTTAVIPEKPVAFDADKPFIYFITDNETGNLIFAGHLVNPKK
jgi:serpin B